ncbi:MAG: nucleotidyl transferase AbiEii/AbiGii toxin family protein, partial [Candidatus Magasanikbacteria bacterium]|nr:nucleotidyl transferase AbiEii/AbiGii toxin family protein [Candidatus Magasanikbacteria bacterium]
KYPLLFPFVDFEKINLADERDIAAMKIDAISSRGSKKDFIDLFFLLKKYSLNELIDFFTQKYHGIEYNLLHILKSLSFFEDADLDPEPTKLVATKWEDAKREISRQAHKKIG